MAVPPIRLLRPEAMKIDADTPYVLDIRIPIALPHQLDPSLPAPPYHPGTTAADSFHHAAAVLEVPTQATSGSCAIRFVPGWDAFTVADKETGFDVAAGYWKDTFGREGHGPIDAYGEGPWGQIAIYRSFKLYLVRGVRNAKELEEVNPRAFRYDVVEEGSGEPGVHELVFEVKEYTKEVRTRHVNVSASIGMEIGGLPERAG